MKRTTSRALDRIDDALAEFLKASGATPEMFVSEEGIACAMRVVSDAFGDWRECPVKRCRRARCCQGPDMICQVDGPRVNAPPAEIARANARMREIVERHVARLDVLW